MFVQEIWCYICLSWLRFLSKSQQMFLTSSKASALSNNIRKQAQVHKRQLSSLQPHPQDILCNNIHLACIFPCSGQRVPPPTPAFYFYCGQRAWGRGYSLARFTYVSAALINRKAVLMTGLQKIIIFCCKCCITILSVLQFYVSKQKDWMLLLALWQADQIWQSAL